MVVRGVSGVWVSPLASVPPAHADGLDVIIDPIINSILNSVTDSVAGLDVLARVDPTAGLDLGLPATDLGWPGLAGLGSGRGRGVGGGSARPRPRFPRLYDQFIYDPSHTWDQQWIDGTTFLGNADGAIRQLRQQLGSGHLADRQRRGRHRRRTLAQADGAGGLWFGDGGTGCDATRPVAAATAALPSTATAALGGAGGSDIDAAGDGGAADGGTAYGIAGGGGAGGDGIEGGGGGIGGDGGDATGFFFGNGGAGGDGGDRRSGHHR